MEQSNEPRVDKRVVLASFIGTFVAAGLNMATMTAARLVIPLIALSMGANAALVGIIAALFTAVPMLFSISFGRWLDRMGTLWPMISAAGMSVLAAIIFCIFPGKYTLLLVAGLIGAGCVFTHMAATRAVGAVGVDSERARNLGYLVLSYSLFQFIGPMVAGASYQHYGALAAVLMLGAYSLISIGVIGLRWHFFRHERAGPQVNRTNGRAYKLLLIGRLRSWVFISSIFAGAQSVYPFVISLYAVQIGMSPIRASWLLGSYAVGIFISRFFTPLATRLFKTQRIIKVALTVGALTYVLIPFNRDIYILNSLSCILGIALGIGIPIALVMIYDAAPDGRINESVGLSMTANNLLQTVFPLVLGMSASQFGVAPMVLAIAVVMIVAALLGMERELPQKETQ